MTPRMVQASARLAGSTVLATQTDERLVALARHGNERAFEALVERYRGSLLRYCGKLLPNSRSEDAVQQAFLNAHTAITVSTTKNESSRTTKKVLTYSKTFGFIGLRRTFSTAAMRI